MTPDPIYITKESITCSNGSQVKLLVPAKIAACRKVLFPDFGITLQKAPCGPASDPKVADYLSTLAAALFMHAASEYPECVGPSHEEHLQQQIFEALTSGWDKGVDIDLRPLFSQSIK